MNLCHVISTHTKKNVSGEERTERNDHDSVDEAVRQVSSCRLWC